MLKRITYLTMAAAVALPMVATAKPLNYNFVELDYLNTDLDGPDGDGFSLKGNFAFTDSFFFTGRYNDSSVEQGAFDADVQRITAGVGFKHAMSDVSSLFATLTYEDVEVDTNTPVDLDDDGFGLGAGIRFAVMENLELNGGLEYLDVGDAIDGEVGFTVGGVFDVTETIGLALGYEDVDDFGEIHAGVRLNF
jgi:opacity protein-like surface antigen